MKFEAAVHGIDLDKHAGVSRQTEAKQEGNIDDVNDNDPDLLFKNPKEYENLSAEDKKKLTEKMMRKWQAWASKSPVK